MVHKVEIDFHGRPLSIEVGRLAKQASGAALVQYGETVVLATVVGTRSRRPGIDFFPLTVDYQEKTFAAGKIPGGFFKREGRPSEKEVLTSRLIDRPIRPLFAKDYVCETQVIATVLSHDRLNDADIVAMVATSAAIHVSDLPFDGPIGAVRVGRLDGKLTINPVMPDYDSSDLSLVVAATRDGIVMVEGGAQMLSEDVMLDALYFAYDEIQHLIKLQEELQAKVGKARRTVTAVEKDAALAQRVEAVANKKLAKALSIVTAMSAAAVDQSAASLVTELAAESPDREDEILDALDGLKKKTVRQIIVSDERRLRRTWSDGHPSHHLRGADPAAHAWFRGLHPW
jgi:polyribonucleotide nucleotidyltransferase